MTTISGTNGDDTLVGSAYDDLILGASGADSLVGIDGVDTLLGGDGNDTLDAGAGYDFWSDPNASIFDLSRVQVSNGGKGDDTYLLTGESGTVVITDEAGVDTLDLTRFAENIEALTFPTSYLPLYENAPIFFGVAGSSFQAEIPAQYFNGGQAAIEFVRYGPHLFDLTWTRSWIDLAGVMRYGASAGDDLLIGGSVLEGFGGGPGNDTLDSGESGERGAFDPDDQLAGGPGDDTYIIRNTRWTTYVLGEGLSDGLDTLDLTGFTASWEALNFVAGVSDLVDQGFVSLRNEDGGRILIQDQYAKSGVAGRLAIERVRYGETLIDVAWTRDRFEWESALRYGSSVTDDTLYGSDLEDRVLGGPGYDWIEGGDGDDSLLGGQGEDTLDGGLGADSLLGGSEDDWLLGADGDDALNGEAGDDHLAGGDGSDTLFGGEGDDTLESGRGALDVMTGGGGQDVYVVNSQSGTTILNVQPELNEVDTLDLTGFADSLAELTFVFVEGDTVSDWGGVSSGTDEILIHNEREGLIRVKGGYDYLAMWVPLGVDPHGLRPFEVLQFGDQRIDLTWTRDWQELASAVGYGATPGDDTLTGDGRDEMFGGGPGHDLLIGGGGADTLYGQAGHDTLVGGVDAVDLLVGGGGGDVYRLDQPETVAVVRDAGFLPANTLLLSGFADSLSALEISADSDGRNLLIRNGAGGMVTIEDQYDPGAISSGRLPAIGAIRLGDQLIDVSWTRTWQEFAATLSGDPPPAPLDRSLYLEEDAIARGQLVAKASPDRTLTFSMIEGPDHGELSLSPDGKFEYRPEANFYGSDAFTFRAFDGTQYSREATVSVLVAPVNDAPVLNLAIADQLVKPGVPFVVTLPPQTFTDDSSDDLIYMATLGDGSPLPEWLAFNAEPLSFIGTPPLDGDGDLMIRITAGDSTGATASGAFRITQSPLVALTGTPAPDTLTGTVTDDVLYGQSGADRLNGLGGDDLLDGGPDLDTAVYAGPLADYAMTRQGEVIRVTDQAVARDGADALVRIERLQFSDMSVNLTVQAVAEAVPQAVLDRICELYAGFFGRVPAANGLENWLNEYRGGMPLDRIADAFYAIGSSEALRGYTGYWDVDGGAELSDEAYVRIVYQNVLGRVGLQGGIDYWTAQLGGDAPRTRGELVSIMLDAAHGQTGHPDWNWSAELLDDRLQMAKQVAVEWGLNYAPTDELAIEIGRAVLNAVTEIPNPNPAYAAVPVKTFDPDAAAALVGIGPGMIDLL